MSKKIEIGSSVFFKRYTDYKSHDTDYIVFVEQPQGFKTFLHINLFDKKEDTFYYKMMSKKEFIEYELNHCKKCQMAAGKFLIPELAEYMNLTIEDLKLFEECFTNMDDKHSYEKIIYNAYIENNGFFLTDNQRKTAYNNYKQKRK